MQNQSQRQAVGTDRLRPEKLGEMREKGFRKKSTFHLPFNLSLLLNYIFFFFFYPGEKGRTLEKCLFFEIVMSIIELDKKRSPKKLEDMDHLDWNIGKAFNKHFHILTLACMSHCGCEHNHFIYSVFTEISPDAKSKISFKVTCK